jgi:hypothetical protein
LAGAGQGKKCARSNINSTDMLSEELKEKRQKFFEEFQQELDRLVREHPDQPPLLKEYVADALLALQSGKYQDAWWRLLSGYNRLGFCKDALSILDLGIFAYRLDGSFLQLHDVVPYLWEKRKDLYPHLANALKATYHFRCLIEAGHKPEDALSRALEVQHELYDMFGYGASNPFMRGISVVMPPDTLAKLRQILLDIYEECLSRR